MGLINQSAAKKAGIAQGDQILEVDGLELKGQSPFEAAALIQSSGDGSNKPSVAIKVKVFSIIYFVTLSVSTQLNNYTKGL